MFDAIEIARRWICKRCPHEEMERENRALRLELSRAVQNLEDVEARMSALKETNIALGCELQRKCNEANAAAAETQMLRKRLSVAEEQLQERRKTETELWQRISALEASLREKTRECQALAEEQVALRRDAEAYEALLRADKLSSASRRRYQQQAAKVKEYRSL